MLIQERSGLFTGTGGSGSAGGPGDQPEPVLFCLLVRRAKLRDHMATIRTNIQHASAHLDERLYISDLEREFTRYGI
jgi:hypothetical protein